MTNATNLILSLFFTVHLQWNANADCVDGYRVYQMTTKTYQREPWNMTWENVGLVTEAYRSALVNHYEWFAVTSHKTVTVDGIETVEETPVGSAWIYFQRD